MKNKNAAVFAIIIFCFLAGTYSYANECQEGEEEAIIISEYVYSCSNLKNIERLPSSLSKNQESDLHKLHIKSTSNDYSSEINPRNCTKDPKNRSRSVCEGDIYDLGNYLGYYRLMSFYKGEPFFPSPYDENESLVLLHGQEFSTSVFDQSEFSLHYNYGIYLNYGNITDESRTRAVRISISRYKCVNIGKCYFMKVYLDHNAKPVATWPVNVSKGFQNEGLKRINVTDEVNLAFFTTPLGSITGSAENKSEIIISPLEESKITGKYNNSRRKGIELGTANFKKLHRWVFEAIPEKNVTIDFTP